MDKDRFRRDMGNVINGYREVLNRLRKLGSKRSRKYGEAKF